jgi:hypothetical protein
LHVSQISLRAASPAELKERIAAERRGSPFVVLRDGEGRQRVVELDEAGPRTIGRSDRADISIDWDTQVSSAHTELRQLAGDWVVIDDGMSRNGTFLNGERVVARRRLRDGDELRVGDTTLLFREPGRRRSATVVPRLAERPPELTQAQRRVLVALCRPLWQSGTFVRPASNRDIADALHLSVAAVKTHLRALFLRLGVEDLPHNEKRVRLVERAFEQGLVSPADLDPDA